jgi:hypothetical protein
MNATRELIDYMVANSPFVVGTDLFQGKIPSTNLDGVVVTHMVVDENDTLMQAIQINCASHYIDYDTANDKLTLLYNLLAYCNGLTLASGYVYNVVPIKPVGFITVTDENKYIFSFSVVCYITRP